MVVLRVAGILVVVVLLLVLRVAKILVVVVVRLRRAADILPV